MRVLSVIATCAAMSFLPCAATFAQRPAISFGATVGGTVSRFTDVDLKAADVLNGESTMANRVGLQAGGYLTVPLTRRLAIQPEVTYSQNGATLNVTGSTSGSLTFALNYASAAALLRADLGEPNAWRPVLLAGPGFAARIHCEGTLKSGSTSLSTSCKEFGDATDPFKSSDITAIGGVGLAGPLMHRVVSLQARYTRGFVTVTKDASSSQSPKNSAFSFLLSFGF